MDECKYNSTQETAMDRRWRRRRRRRRRGNNL